MPVTFLTEEQPSTEGPDMEWHHYTEVAALLPTPAAEQ